MPQDLASTRLDNAMRLFDEFVAATVKHPDAATLRGLERRFAERLGIQPSYWSQIKSRARQIGERLARQFELACHKPRGWMDEGHGVGAASAAQGVASSAAGRADANGLTPPSGPRDDDERFLVDLVLSYYRRNPQRARTRLLELIGEALAPATAPSVTSPSTGTAPGTLRVEDDMALWARSKQGVAPLKPRR